MLIVEHTAELARAANLANYPSVFAIRYPLSAIRFVG
jgi:hypothetical protein